MSNIKSYKEAEDLLQVNRDVFNFARKENNWEVITQGNSYVTNFKRLRPEIQKAIMIIAKDQDYEGMDVGVAPTSDFPGYAGNAGQFGLIEMDGVTLLFDTQGSSYPRYVTRLDGFNMNKYNSMFESKKHPLFENYSRFFNKI